MNSNTTTEDNTPSWLATDAELEIRFTAHRKAREIVAKFTSNQILGYWLDADPLVSLDALQDTGIAALRAQLIRVKAAEFEAEAKQPAAPQLPHPPALRRYRSEERRAAQVEQAVKDLREAARAFCADEITHSELTTRNGDVWCAIAKANLVGQVLAALDRSYRADEAAR
jgi:hypothetical protein